MTAERLASSVTDLVGPREDPAAQRRWLAAERAVCLVALLSLGARIYLPSQVSIGSLLVVASLPAWLGVLRRYRGAVGLAAVTGLALVYGAGLTILALASHYVARSSLTADVSLTLLTFAGVGVVLWGRELLGLRVTGAAVAVGMMVGATLHGYDVTMNAWKGAWALPITTLLLSVTGQRRWWSAAALAALTATSVYFDARAQAAASFVALVLVLWQLRPTRVRRGVHWLLTGLTLVVLAALVYLAATEALVRGYLGVDAQLRSLRQIDAAGTLILGGRPEAAATVALLLSRFGGYGFGVMPRGGDVLTAKEGLLRVNYDPNNGYVDRYMFGNGFELHSVVGDVWVRMGPVGLLLSAVVAVLLFRGLAAGLARRSASGLSLFLTLWTFWNLAFSPWLSAASALTLAVGLALPRVVEGAAAPDPGASNDEAAREARADFASSRR